MLGAGVPASSSSSSPVRPHLTSLKTRLSRSSPPAVFPCRPFNCTFGVTNLKLKQRAPTASGAGFFPRRVNLKCNSSTHGPGPGPGDSESRTILDAFFLGKALGEALVERLESTVGEILSTVGRLQSEQQKQVLEFQEDVLERAKRAKEKAAQEAMEAQGLVTKASNAASTREPSASSVAVAANTDPTNSDPGLGVSNED